MVLLEIMVLQEIADPLEKEERVFLEKVFHLEMEA